MGELVGIQDRSDGDHDAVGDLERGDPERVSARLIEDEARLAVDERRPVCESTLASLAAPADERFRDALGADERDRDRRRLAATVAVNGRVGGEEFDERRRVAFFPRAEEAAGRFVAQSFAGWPYARKGGQIKTEEDPLDPTPVPTMRKTLDAIGHLEEAVVDAGGLALRYGDLYGSPQDAQLELVRKRRFPIVGDGGGIWSFVHLDDAAAATVLALERGASGIYNVVDDEPAPVREWLPALAAAIGARPPRRIPRWLARIVAGEAGVALMTEVRGASNQKAKREFGWTPRYPSWRDGFRAAYGGERA